MTTIKYGDTVVTNDDIDAMYMVVQDRGKRAVVTSEAMAKWASKMLDIASVSADEPKSE